MADNLMLSALKVFTVAFALNWWRYILLAGALYGLFYLRPGSGSALPGWRTDIRRGQIRREFLMSTVACAVIALAMVGIYVLRPYGVVKLYKGNEEYGIIYGVISFVLMVIIFDAYFYFTHRMLHLLGTRRTTHDQHHSATLPTPWSALAFSVPEASIIAIFFFAITLIMPIKTDVYRVFVWFVFLQSAVVHTSREIYPRAWLRWPIFKFFTAPHHHLLHHRYGAHNFGLYFTFWDRVMKTEHPRYRASLGDGDPASTA